MDDSGLMAAGQSGAQVDLLQEGESRQIPDLSSESCLEAHQQQQQQQHSFLFSQDGGGGDDSSLEMGELVCPVCEGPVSDPLLLSCLHSVCRSCKERLQTEGQADIKCARCGVSSKSLAHMFTDYLHSGVRPAAANSLPHSLAEDVKLTLEEATVRALKIPDDIANLTSSLSELQEDRDNARDLIEETYQSYRAVLEQCKESALARLEELHNQRELAIMEALEDIDLAQGSLEHALTYGNRLMGEFCNTQAMELLPQVRTHISRTLARLDSGLGVAQQLHPLRWISQEEQFTRAVQANFGQFVAAPPSLSPTGRPPLLTAGDGPLLVAHPPPSATTTMPTEITVSNSSAAQQLHQQPNVIDSRDGLGKALLKTHSPVFSQGLLAVGNISPTSLQVPLSSPQGSLSVPLGSPRIGRAHGSIGSSVSSPAHQFVYTRMGHSQPDLLGRGHTPPLLGRGGHTPPLLGGQDVGTADYSLVQLASMAENLERGGGGPVQHNFTLADLISNVSEEQHKSWEEPNPSTPSHALCNLAALAKLDEFQEGTARWQVDHGLLLADLDRSNLSRSLSGLHSDPVSPGTHSVSPVLGGLGVPGLSTRGASPLSPIDSLMPGLGGMSPIPPLRGGLLGQQAGQRALNPMQIRCKFGTLGPGKGQFNSPHGFCLGVEEEIIVADTNNHRIQVFEKNGTYRYQFGVPGKEEGQLWYPRKVAVMKNSGKFVICDRGNERSRMQIFTKHGHFVRKIAIRYIDIVAGLAITREGNIVAVDSVTPTMFVISENGDLLRWFDCADFMREPSDIAVAGSEFFVCDFKGHNVVVFSEEGVFQRRIGCESITNFPNGIDISDAGDILIGDSHGNRFHVAVFGNDGTLLGEFECPHVKVSRCCGLKITSEGYVVTLAKNNHHVLVLNTLYIA